MERASISPTFPFKLSLHVTRARAGGPAVGVRVTIPCHSCQRTQDTATPRSITRRPQYRSPTTNFKPPPPIRREDCSSPFGDGLRPLRRHRQARTLYLHASFRSTSSLSIDSRIGRFFRFEPRDMSSKELKIEIMGWLCDRYVVKARGVRGMAQGDFIFAALAPAPYCRLHLAAGALVAGSRKRRARGKR